MAKCINCGNIVERCVTQYGDVPCNTEKTYLLWEGQIVTGQILHWEVCDKAQELVCMKGIEGVGTGGVPEMREKLSSMDYMEDVELTKKIFSELNDLVVE
jgi:hypothetical protein